MKSTGLICLKLLLKAIAHKLQKFLLLERAHHRLRKALSPEGHNLIKWTNSVEEDSHSLSSPLRKGAASAILNASKFNPGIAAKVDFRLFADFPAPLQPCRNVQNLTGLTRGGPPFRTGSELSKAERQCMRCHPRDPAMKSLLSTGTIANVANIPNQATHFISTGANVTALKRQCISRGGVEKAAVCSPLTRSQIRSNFVCPDNGSAQATADGSPASSTASTPSCAPQ